LTHELLTGFGAKRSNLGKVVKSKRPANQWICGPLTSFDID